MGVFQSVAIDAREQKAIADEVTKTLRDLGAELGEGFKVIGMPHLMLGGADEGPDGSLDLSPFRGRLKLGGTIYSGETQHAPGGPTRLNLLRSGPDRCGSITVGRSDLNSTSITSYESVTIGDNVHFEPRVTIMDCPGHPANRRLPDALEHVTIAPVVIEDDAFIGFGATIMPGVTIGTGAVVKPGAMVMWDVPAHAVVVGNPAKSIKVFRKYLKKS